MPLLAWFTLTLSSVLSVSLLGSCLSWSQASVHAVMITAAVYNVDQSFDLLPCRLVFQIGQCRLLSVLWDLRISLPTQLLSHVATIGTHALAVLLGCLS